MSLPILQPNSTQIPQVRGDVTIDSSVIFASGVILNATPGNKITIHAGVCLGMGTIITAHQGDVEIKANAILGPGTLIIGNCIIGSQVSLGTSVTVFHTSIDNLAVIPAGSIIGDYSRKLDVSVETGENTENENNISEQNRDQNILEKINQLNQNIHATAKPSDISSPEKINTSKKEEQKRQEKMSVQEFVEPVNPQEESIQQKEPIQDIKSKEEFTNTQRKTAPTQSSAAKKENTDAQSSPENIVESKEVVGKVYINRLLYTLFPEKNYRQK